MYGGCGQISLMVYCAEIGLKWVDNFNKFWKDGWNVFDFAITLIVCIRAVIIYLCAMFCFVCMIVACVHSVLLCELYCVGCIVMVRCVLLCVYVVSVVLCVMGCVVFY